MYRTNTVGAIYLTILLFFSSCSMNSYKRFSRGELKVSEFNESISFENLKGLAILPVKINGITYRFLFDSGAPTSISKRLQAEYKFRVIDGGDIKDSEGFKTKIEYVSVDSLQLGEVFFTDQTAFVGDFEKNPILACMNVDGIFGSNTQRFCNWTIDFSQETIQFFSAPVDSDGNFLNFTTDHQYDINLDLELEGATIENITLDYGSNGSISIDENGYDNLETFNIIDTSIVRVGYSQSGISGNVNEIRSKYGRINQVSSIHHAFDSMRVSVRKSRLLGTDILSKAVVTIDWGNHRIWFEDTSTPFDPGKAFGLSLGYSSELGVYVLSVFEGSPGYLQGIRPGFKAIQLGDILMNDLDSYCDYVRSDFSKTERINFKFIDANQDTIQQELRPFIRP